LRVFLYLSGEEIICEPGATEGGHGGADLHMVEAFLNWLDDPACRPKTTGPEGLEAMVVACGIDLARREGRVVELDELRNEV